MISRLGSPPRLASGVFVLDYTRPGTATTKSGAVLHYQDIENYMYVQVNSGAGTNGATSWTL